MANFHLYVVFLLYSACLCLSRVVINPSCGPPRKGVCVNVWRCPSYAKTLNQGTRSRDFIEKMRENHCGFVDQKTPKVCCSDLAQTTQSLDGLRNHPNLHLLPKSCGSISPGTRITEGGMASPGEFPWMALIAYKTGYSPDDEDFKCGGSLINEKYVLTAAHCLDESSILGIRLGEHDIRTEYDCDKKGKNCQPPIQDILISEIIVHENYNPSTYVNDIALIRLATPADFSYDNVQPICLPQDDLLTTNLVGKSLTVTGWGTTSSGHKSLVLSKVKIPVVPLIRCIKLYGKYKPISNNQICAGGYMGRDSCSGDSGGPLQYIASVDDTHRYVQGGIVSYGPAQCGLKGRPAIYTNVKKYMTWILDNIDA